MSIRIIHGQIFWQVTTCLRVFKLRQFKPETDGASLTNPDKTTKYRDVYEFVSAGEIVATSSMLGNESQWVIFMSGKFSRKKSARYHAMPNLPRSVAASFCPESTSIASTVAAPALRPALI